MCPAWDDGSIPIHFLISLDNAGRAVLGERRIRDLGAEGTSPDTQGGRGRTAGERSERALLAGALAALEDGVAALREQLDAANARAEQGRDGERARVVALRDRIEVL